MLKMVDRGDEFGRCPFRPLPSLFAALSLCAKVRLSFRIPPTPSPFSHASWLGLSFLLAMPITPFSARLTPRPFALHCPSQAAPSHERSEVGRRTWTRGWMSGSSEGMDVGGTRVTSSHASDRIPSHLSPAMPLPCSMPPSYSLSHLILRLPSHSGSHSIDYLPLAHAS
ncbi:hypothetical protein BT69DRAFT_267668 [Atractiella rhizophila]|nr:hypothetical protein BT69DRAFT_267668 [Atractiella rhizophila]